VVRPTFSFSVVDVDDVHVVSLRGDLDIATGIGLADWLVGVSGSTVVVDLSELTFMDSSGLSTLLLARTRITEKGDTMLLTRPREGVRRVLTSLA
jgi:anti-sigma B factor antagonist